MIRNSVAASAFAALFLAAAPASAKDDEPPLTLTKCERTYGSIAIVEGDTQGWVKFGLGSPRDLINALALESNCFTPYDAASGQQATYLMNVIAGDKAEVDRGMQVASRAASTLARRAPIPGAGLVGGMLGGFGGQRKTLAAALRLINPMNGQTIIQGSGEVRKTTITLGGVGGVLQSGAQSSGYASSKDGQMLVEAFIKAFNGLSAQGASLQPASTEPAPAEAPASQ